MQLWSHRFLLAVACALGMPATAAAEVIELEVGFEEPVVTIDAAGFAHVQVPDSTVHGIPGEPALPGRALMVALPPGQDVVAVEVERIGVDELAGPFVLFPAQPPRRLSQRGPFPFVPADAAVYGDRAVFPERVAVLGPQQRAAGLEVAPIVVYPVVWDRATGSLSFSRRMRLRLSTVARQTVAVDLARFRGLTPDLERARRWLVNPVLLERYTPPPRRLAPPYRYVIITSAALSTCAGPDNLQALAASKDARGIPSRIETVETIRGAYAGRDDAEKIRAFIRDLYDNNSTEFVLLAGDADRASMGGETENPVVPARDLYGILDAEADVIPSDLYYACLDGDFDENQNGVFGEPADNPDVLPDVMVGRAAVDSCAEVSNFVRKTLAYQNAEPATLGDVHMLGEFLWGDGSDDYDWGKGYLEQIRVSSNDLDMSTMGFSESPFYVVDTMYDRDLGGSEAWDGADVLNLINNQSPHIINHLGHSYTVYNMRLLSDDIIDGMSNTQPFFEYSQGCYCGAFDNRLDSEYNRVVYPQDAFVEHMTVDAYGAFAAVMNTRYGLGGISNYYHRLFWDALFDGGEARLGPMHAHSLASMAGWVADANYRWVQYEVTLFGDPELSLHHSVPVAQPVIVLPAEGPWFGTIYGYDDVEQRQITIENGGEAPLNWTASWTASWLGVTPQTGTAPTDIVVTADPAGLGVGLHQAEITFAAAGATNSPQTLPVDYYVVEVAAATAAYTSGASPTADGTRSLGEYDDATVVDMSSRSGPATMYALNDGDYLYLAFAIEGDTDVSLNDALVLLIDGDNDDQWPPAPGPSDGQLQVYGDGEQTFYRTYNDGSGLQPEDSPSTPAGVTSAFGTDAGHRWIELRFDLSTSVIDRAAGESFGVFAFYHDWVVTDYVMEAVWPDIASSFDDGRFLGNVTLGTTGSNVAASPAPLSFSAAQSASPTEPQFVTLTSSSSEILSFSLTTSQPWLHVSPTSGSTPAMIQVWVEPAGLSVGERAGAVTVSAAAADNSPFDIGVTLDVVEAPPVFALSTGHLGFAYTVGDLLPASQTIDIDNVGGGSLDWTASTTATWVTVAPTSGAAPGQIDVTPVITAGMEPGYRAGTLVLSAPGAEDAVVSLGLDLAAQPHVVVGPAAVTRSDVPGAGSVTIELTIENLEQGNMPWSASTSASWATVKPVSGTYVTSHPSRVNLTLEPGSLALGSHEAAVIVSCTAADNSPVTVPITWTLVDAPVIAVSPAELSFAARSVGSSPPSQTLSIDNPGSGLLDFVLACDPAWLSCAPASGTAPAAITVAVDASGLAVGHHAGTITVSAAAAIHSPVIVDVGLLIESGSNAPPPAPALLSPVDGAANQGTRPTLGIENAADPDGDAVTYTFEVAVSGASTPVVVVEEVTEGTGNSTETTLPAQLAPSTTYTWRARAVDLWGAEGAWSDSWSFTVAAASPSRPSTATSEGCACSSSGDSPAWLLGLGALFLMRRRRALPSSQRRAP